MAIDMYDPQLGRYYKVIAHNKGPVNVGREGRQSRSTREIELEELTSKTSYDPQSFAELEERDSILRRLKPKMFGIKFDSDGNPIVYSDTPEKITIYRGGSPVPLDQNGVRLSAGDSIEIALDPDKPHLGRLTGKPVNTPDSYQLIINRTYADSRDFTDFEVSQQEKVKRQSKQVLKYIGTKLVDAYHELLNLAKPENFD